MRPFWCRWVPFWLDVRGRRLLRVRRAVDRGLSDERIPRWLVPMVRPAVGARAVALDSLHVIDAPAELPTNSADVRSKAVRRDLRHHEQSRADIGHEGVCRLLVTGPDAPRDDQPRQRVHRHEGVRLADAGRILLGHARASSARTRRSRRPGSAACAGHAPAGHAGAQRRARRPARDAPRSPC